MKFIIFLLLAMLVGATPAASQTRKSVRSKVKNPARAVKPAKLIAPAVSEAADPPPPPKPRAAKVKTNERFASDVFKEAAINKWGVAAVSFPEDLMSETESTTPTDNGRIKWTTYSRYWKQSGAFYPSSLEVDLDVTTWDADFKSLVPELRPDLATPENLVLLEFTGDFQKKNKPGSFVLDAQIIKIGEVEGAFSRAKSPSGKNRFLIVWSTYRYYENKAQRITISVTGRNEAMTKALKIINSLKLEAVAANSPVETR